MKTPLLVMFILLLISGSALAQSPTPSPLIDAQSTSEVYRGIIRDHEVRLRAAQEERRQMQQEIGILKTEVQQNGLMVKVAIGCVLAMLVLEWFWATRGRRNGVEKKDAV